MTDVRTEVDWENFLKNSVNGDQNFESQEPQVQYIPPDNLNSLIQLNEEKYQDLKLIYWKLFDLFKNYLSPTESVTPNDGPSATSELAGDPEMQGGTLD